MASDWSREVAYAENHDPGEIVFSDNTSVFVDYEEIPWETVQAWPQGRALRLVWSPESGIELVDIASNRRMHAVFDTTDEHPVDLLTKQCMQQPPFDDAECLDAAYQRWNQEVKRTYHELLARGATKSDRNRLRVAQRNWIAYRDAQGAAIDLIIGGRDGTIWRNVSKRERIQLIREQQRRLQRMAHDWLRP